MLFASLGWQHALAQTFTSDGLVYNVTSSSTVEVGNQNYAATGTIIIPPQVTHNSTVYSVTNIIGEAFDTCIFLTSVTIPNTVTSIGNFAFLDCGLTSVICNATTPITINSSVFSGVYQNQCSLTVPAGSVAAYEAAAVWQNFSPITSANSTVYNTTTVTACASYTWANNNQTYTATGVYTGTTTNGITEQLDLTITTPPTNFSSGGLNYTVTSPTTVAVTTTTGLTGSIAIPSLVNSACGTYSVTSIGNGAFNNNIGITSVTIPNSVTTIGTAFQVCTGLTSITLSNSLTSIGSTAFYNCTGLTSITLPNSLTSIGTDAFRGCSGLTSVTIPNSLTSISDRMFNSCSGLISVNIPNSITSIGKGVFGQCISLTSVTIPSSVTLIDVNAFANCIALTSIICNITSPLVINANVFGGVNQGACSLTVPAASIGAYQAAAVWQDFAPITSSTVYNTTTITACGTYTWANNNETYTETGVYTGTTTNGITEQLDLTITTPPTSFTSDGINYVVTSPTTVAVGNNTGATGVVVIPASVTTACGTYDVTSIGNNAFFGASGLTSVTIPNSVTSIGYSAFDTCFGLTSVTIPNSVTSIGYGAFSTCSGLTSITLPNTLTSISLSMLAGCSKLSSITIPDSVTSIGSVAFDGCSGLTSVICNVSTPITIDSYVFQGLNQSACSLIVPAGSVAAYEAAAVWQNFAPIVSNPTYNTTNISACSSYTWQVNNLTYITNGTYTYASTNDNINYTVEILNLTLQLDFIIDGINYVVTSPTTVAVGDNATATGDVVIPSTITTTCGTYAVTSIGNSAFYGASGITSVTIPNSVTSIGDNAFSQCSGLTSVTIPNSVTSIGYSAFDGCTGLTSVTIPNSVTSIGDYAFAYCSGLTSVTIPNSVTSIGYSAFRGCSSLTSITIPNSVTSIGYRAFRGCSNLTTVTIGNSVTFIDDQAFRDCTGLTSIICNVSTPITINSNVFQGVNQPACSLTVPADSVAAYEAAAVWQNFNPINSIVYNTTTVTACSSYTWANNNETYTETGVYTGTTTNGITEQLDLTITTPPTSFTSDGINYVVTSPTTVAVGNNTSATGVVVIPASVTTACGTYDVTSIGTNAFTASDITSITIPSSVASIGDDAFGSCGNLTSFICDVISPITINFSVFGDVNIAACSLTVPAESLAAYQAAAVWQEFASINGISLVNPTFAATSLQLYPVPVKNTLYIQSSNNMLIDKITITDLTGKIVVTQTTNTNQVEVHELTSGMYIIQAVAGDSTFVRKFIKE